MAIATAGGRRRAGTSGTPSDGSSSLLGVAIALDTTYTGHTPAVDPKTATGHQANDYMNDRTARIYPGLVTHPS